MQKRLISLLFLNLILLLFLLEKGCFAQEKQAYPMSSSYYNYMTTPDGARIRYRYWPATRRLHEPHPPKNIIILQGRASFVEKFEGIIQSLHKRHYNVWAFDWRGQGLSSRQLNDAHKGHIDSYEIYLNDLDQFIHEIVLPHLSGPLMCLSQSMGAHLALRYMHKRPDILDLAVLTAPMIDLKTGAYSKSMARLLAHFANKIGFHESYVFGHGVYDPKKEPFEGNLLTHDRESFFLHRKFLKENPRLSLGGATFGWLDATFQSIDIVNRKEFLQKIKKPILVVTAGREAVVDNSFIPQMCQWLKKSKLVVYPNAKHQILTETQDILDQFWGDFDLFVDEHYPQIEQQYLTKRGLIKTPELARVERLYPTLSNYVNSS